MAGTGGAPVSGAGSNAAFNWPEATADGGSSRLCRSGHYVGTYSCNVTYGDAGGFNYALTGPVDLTLGEAQEGEFLTVSGGTLKSAAAGLQLDSGVVGKLNCDNGAFDGTLQNGTLSIPPFPPGGTFNGQMNAAFSAEGPKLAGTWTLNGEGTFAGYQCKGPWTATWTP